MASAADRRMLALLSTAQGHLIYIKETRRLGFVINNLIDELGAHIALAMKEWPADFSPKELKKLESIILEWGKHIDTFISEADKLVVLFSVVTQCLYDIYFFTKNLYKKSLLNPMFPVIEELEKKIDPLGNKFDEYEKAKDLRKELYLLLGFTEDLI